MPTGFMSALLARLRAPKCQDPYFGRMRFVRDCWIGRVPNHEGVLIEVMLMGDNPDQRDFRKHQEMYDLVLQRTKEIVHEARSLMEMTSEQSGLIPSMPTDFIMSCTLEHVALPDMENDDLRWDLTIQACWPKISIPPEPDEVNEHRVLFVIEMDGWRSIAAALV